MTPLPPLTLAALAAALLPAPQAGDRVPLIAPKPTVTAPTTAPDEPAPEPGGSEEPGKESADGRPAWAADPRWRELGPTAMGGRICGLAVVPDAPTTFYVGAAGGGVFKTTDGGITFDPLFQDAPGISVGAIALAPSDPQVIYVGTGEANPRNSVTWGSGVYKSTDGGETWANVGLERSFQIGRIAFHPADPDTAFVGALGRLWGPGGQRGLFKTADGGETWNRVLEGEGGAGCIDVAFKPGDPSTLLAATYERRRGPYDVGDPAVRFGPGSALWRSTDGGDNWEEMTDGLPTCDLGRIGLSWHAADPSIVFATVESETIGTAPEGTKLPALMGIRGEDQSSAGGEPGALLTQVTEDGPAGKAGLKNGDRVVKLGDDAIESYRDLVAGIRERFAGDTVTVEAVRADDERVAAEVTFAARGGGDRPFGGRLGGQVANVQEKQGPDGFQTGGVYKSEDAGRTWTRVNSLNPRPFYFSRVVVDPVNPDNVYVCGIRLHGSTDGGKTFEAGVGHDTHADHHDLWVDPADPDHLLLACDGGLNVSYDRAGSWHFIDNLPLAQFYDVGVDTSDPYRVMGGLQDNGSWVGPALKRGRRGPGTFDWLSVGGGDGFVTTADPEDPDLIYWESQYGGLNRVHLGTGERRSVRPRLETDDGERVRWNWKTPYVLSPHNSRIVYSAGNRVFRSLNRGEDAEVLSPNLARTDRGTATALAESPVKAGVIWAGTDDGNLWVTRDGGGEWAVAPVPTLGRINALEPSRTDAGRCYLTIDTHYYDGTEPAAYVTDDYGRSWKSLVEGLPAEAGTTRALREDPVNADVLYLACEFGLYASADRGETWASLHGDPAEGGLPRTAVHEVAAHPTEPAVVAGTHGRGLWVLDVTPLRGWTAELTDADERPGHLFDPPAATLWHDVVGKKYFGQQHFFGENPTRGAVLWYHLAAGGEGKAGDPKLEVLDVTGEVVARVPTRRRGADAPGPGLHRAVWDLRRKAEIPEGTSSARARYLRSRGVRAEPGTYAARLTVTKPGGGGFTQVRPLNVEADPDHPADTFTFEEDEAVRQLRKVLAD